MPQRTTGNTVKVPGDSFRLIKPLVGFRNEIIRQLEKFPYEKNVFLMMRFRKENRALSDFIIRHLAVAELNGVRADQAKWNITNNVYNPIAVLYCCKYGIALFDKAETNQAYNPNVIYELGIMHNLRRECLILRNDSLPAVPFDLIKDLYMPYKGELALRTNIQVWLQKITDGGTRSASTQKDTDNSEVTSPDNISATEFTWQVLSKDKKSWKMSWSINITNKSRKEVNANIQILFLDKDGFALDDHIGAPIRALAPDKSRLYEATYTMSPDLASRVQRVKATVMKAK